MKSQREHRTSFSSMLIKVGLDVTTCEVGHGTSVSLEDVDAIVAAFVPWKVSRQEVVTLAAIWAHEYQSNDPRNSVRDRTAQAVLASVFGATEAFHHQQIMRRLRKLGMIVHVTPNVFDPIEKKLIPSRVVGVFFYQTFLLSSQFYMLLEVMDSGQTFSELCIGNTCESLEEVFADLLINNDGKLVGAFDNQHDASERPKNKSSRKVPEILFEMQSSGGFGSYILNRDVESQLNTILAILKHPDTEALKDWGLVEEKGDRGMCILLHGPAGTGKTSGARALAAELNTKLYATSIERIESKWMGESEQHLHKMFQEYWAAVKRESSVPILLIDECEYLFSRRVAPNGGSDTSHNNMVGIALKEMDSLPGILIATTNLLENLDPAFSRRFDHKVFVDRPDKSAQRRLWELYLKPSIPGREEIQIDTLLNAGDFTGAVIERIVQNACRAIITDPTREKRLRTDDLVAACLQEQRASFDASNKGFLGFA